VAIHVGQALVLVRSPYRAEWNFPGGTVQRGETPELAARRELWRRLVCWRVSFALQAAPAAYGTGEETMYTFRTAADRLPDLRLDNREIIDAQLAPQPN
jgi:hypothetical protein